MPESFGNHSCFFDYPFNTFCAISMYSSRTTAGEIIRIFPAKRKIQEKKIAMGHKPDDHEETPRQDMGGMTMG